MTLNALIKINGTEITEHNRRITTTPTYLNVDLNLASGSFRRFYKPKRASFSLSWTYLPDKAAKTVDSRVGRDFLYSLVTGGSLVTLSIQDNKKDEWNNYTCIVSSYSENMLKNVIQSQCRYFDVDMTLEEV
jgi:hypothetical protein